MNHHTEHLYIMLYINYTSILSKVLIENKFLRKIKPPFSKARTETSRQQSRSDARRPTFLLILLLQGHNDTVILIEVPVVLKVDCLHELGSCLSWRRKCWKKEFIS